MKKKGFTLAEVLVTLGIVGVIAAVTIPLLSNGSQAAQVGAKNAKAKAIFEQANMMMLNDLGIDSISDEFGSGENFDFQGYVKELSKHLKIRTAELNDTSIKYAFGLAPVFAEAPIVDPAEKIQGHDDSTETNGTHTPSPHNPPSGDDNNSSDDDNNNDNNNDNNDDSSSTDTPSIPYAGGYEDPDTTIVCDPNSDYGNEISWHRCVTDVNKCASWRRTKKNTKNCIGDDYIFGGYYTCDDCNGGSSSSSGEPDVNIDDNPSDDPNTSSNTTSNGTTSNGGGEDEGDSNIDPIDSTTLTSDLSNDVINNLFSNNTRSFDTAGGFSYGIITPPNFAAGLNSSLPAHKQRLGIIIIDIDGANHGANKLAVDRFGYALFNDGSLRPIGGKAWDGSTDTLVTWQQACGENSTPQNNSNALACTGSLFANNLKVRYKLK